jgi:hypothetical protein
VKLLLSEVAARHKPIYNYYPTLRIQRKSRTIFRTVGGRILNVNFTEIRYFITLEVV